MNARRWWLPSIGMGIWLVFFLGLWLLHHELLSEGSDLVLSTILVLLAALTCSVHWLARPS